MIYIDVILLLSIDMSSNISPHVVIFIFLLFVRDTSVHLHVDGIIKRSISVRKISYVDGFIPKKVNLVEFKQHNVDECICIVISWCILVNMDSYSYVYKDICWDMHVKEVGNSCIQPHQHWYMYLDWFRMIWFDSRR